MSKTSSIRISLLVLMTAATMCFVSYSKAQTEVPVLKYVPTNNEYRTGVLTSFLVDKNLQRHLKPTRSQLSKMKSSYRKYVRSGGLFMTDQEKQTKTDLECFLPVYENVFSPEQRVLFDQFWRWNHLVPSDGFMKSITKRKFLVDFQLDAIALAEFKEIAEWLDNQFIDEVKKLKRGLASEYISALNESQRQMLSEGLKGKYEAKNIPAVSQEIFGYTANTIKLKSETRAAVKSFHNRFSKMVDREAKKQNAMLYEDRYAIEVTMMPNASAEFEGLIGRDNYQKARTAFINWHFSKLKRLLDESSNFYGLHQSLRAELGMDSKLHKQLMANLDAKKLEINTQIVDSANQYLTQLRNALPKEKRMTWDTMFGTPPREFILVRYGFYLAELD